MSSEAGTVPEWFRTHTYRAADFSLDEIAERKAALGIEATLILPTRNVRSTIGSVLSAVATLSEGMAPLLDQILVVDANSTDGTTEVAKSFGVEVWSEDALAPAVGPVLGKGDAMWRSLVQARGDIVLFADADTVDFKVDLIAGILGVLVFVPSMKFVKAAFGRPFATVDQSLADEGGRVTELTARPLLNLFFPALAGFVQPLAGEFGARRDLLERVPFVTGYGVESGLLIDVCEAAGIDAMGQVDVGYRQNRHQPLHDLSRMSFAVARTILQRARTGSQSTAPGPAAAEVVGAEAAGVYLHAAATHLGLTLTTHNEALVERPPQRPTQPGSTSVRVVA
jgi:glucosyl-3-phosphoglycerate synthase